MTIYEILAYKAKEEINDLDADERKVGERLAINDIYHMSDEMLLQQLSDRGLI